MGRRQRRESFEARMGRDLGRTLTDREKRISRLSEVAPKLASYESREFARSLVRAFVTKGRLTEKQWWWVEKLIHTPQAKQRSRATVAGKFFVYAVAAAKHVKIGFSDKPDNRIREIQTGCPYPVRLIGAQQFDTENGARAREKELHDKFARRRALGEWFHDDIRDELLLMLRGGII